MYLSRAFLNLSNDKVIKDLSNYSRMYNMICSLFEDNTNSKQGSIRVKNGVLYRIDYNNYSNAVTILIQSQTAPNWKKFLKKNPGYFIENTAQTKNYDFFIDKLTEGKTYRFKLKANPVKKKLRKEISENSESSTDNTDNNAHRKFSNKEKSRMPFKKQQEQTEWFINKAKKSGFLPLIIKIPNNPKTYDYISSEELLSFDSSRKKNKITIHSVIFEGNLKITDIEKFKEALIKGIGPAKAFGFGMISIAPIGY